MRETCHTVFSVVASVLQMSLFSLIAVLKSIQNQPVTVLLSKVLGEANYMVTQRDESVRSLHWKASQHSFLTKTALYLNT